MNTYTLSVLSCILLFFGMVSFTALGHRAGRRRLRSKSVDEEFTTAVVDAAIMSLLGLLIAFTFSKAYSRYEKRRDLIVQEVNEIGTAYMRLQLLPAERQASLRAKFHDYVTSRYQTWLLLDDRAAAQREYEKSVKLQSEIWSDAVDATNNDTDDARKLLLPALNDMIDITTTRLIAMQSHPPLLVYLLLGALSLAAAWTIGFGMAGSERLSLLHAVGFAGAITLALFVTLDIEFPRHGFVRLDAPHEMLLQLSEEMK